MTEREKTCEQLSAYLDGELSPQEARRVEEAVQADADLAKELAGLRATRDLLRKLPRHRAPADFVERVVAQAERVRLMEAPPVRAQDRPTAWARYLATAAVLLIAAGVGVVITVALWNNVKAPTPGDTGTIAHSPARAPGGYGLRDEDGDARKEKFAREKSSAGDGLGDSMLLARSDAKRDYREVLKEWTKLRADAVKNKNIVVDVPDLNAAEVAVKNVLRNRGIEPGDAVKPEPKADTRSLALSNNGYYYVNTDRNQAEYIVIPNTESEVPKLEAELSNDIVLQRGNYRVIAAAEKPAGEEPVGKVAYSKSAPKVETFNVNGSTQTIASGAGRTTTADTTMGPSTIAGRAGGGFQTAAADTSQAQVKAEGPKQQTEDKAVGAGVAQVAVAPAPTTRPQGGNQADQPLARPTQVGGQLSVQTGWRHEEILQEIVDMFQGAEYAQKQQGPATTQPAVQVAQQVQRPGEQEGQAGQPAASQCGGKVQPLLITINLKFGLSTTTPNIATSAPNATLDTKASEPTKDSIKK